MHAPGPWYTQLCCNAARCALLSATLYETVFYIFFLVGGGWVRSTNVYLRFPRGTGLVPAGAAGEGLLVLTGGRPGLYLWVSADFGGTWSQFNLAIEHNRLVQTTPTATNISELLYGSEVVGCQNYTCPRADPPATSSYTGIAFAGDGALVISYDRLSNGWAGPPGVWGSFDALFTMRVQLSHA